MLFSMGISFLLFSSPFYVLYRCGFESWESIWGIWNQLNLRDAEATRRFASIERLLSSLFSLQLLLIQFVVDIFPPFYWVHNGNLLLPLSRMAYEFKLFFFSFLSSPQIYASKWPNGASTLWTIVNRYKILYSVIITNFSKEIITTLPETKLVFPIQLQIPISMFTMEKL